MDSNSTFKGFYIGRHFIADPVLLAPMAGVTDVPFRHLCRKLGAGLTTTEMVNANSLLYGSEKTLRRASHEGQGGIVSVQIAGGCPKLLTDAAKFSVDNGAHIIDINMGCPAKKVCNTIAGSALLKDEPLVRTLLEAVVKAVDVPVTLKIRTGWNAETKNGVTIAKMAEDLGIQALAVHGRTRACAYRGEAEYQTIAEIKQAIKIPVIANGDIITPEKAKHVLDVTAADGIMIGRAAQGRPWIFREISHYLRNGTKMSDPSALEIKELMLSHLNTLYKFYGEIMGVKIARKHVGWYCKGQVGASNFRSNFNTLELAEQQLLAIDNFFKQLMDEAA